MQPVIKHLPLTESRLIEHDAINDTTSGVKNVDDIRAFRERQDDPFPWTAVLLVAGVFIVFLAWMILNIPQPQP
jgi:hypothetical protein